MALPTLTGTARLTADPELRITPTGTTIAKLGLAFNARKKDPASGEWVDGDVFYVTATLFGTLAENACESLAKGSEVVVSGRLKTRQWETDTGEKRTAVELLTDELGPALRWATATPRKTTRTPATAPPPRPRPRRHRSTRRSEPPAPGGSAAARTAGPRPDRAREGGEHP